MHMCMCMCMCMCMHMLHMHMCMHMYRKPSLVPEFSKDSQAARERVCEAAALTVERTAERGLAPGLQKGFVSLINSLTSGKKESKDRNLPKEKQICPSGTVGSCQNKLQNKNKKIQGLPAQPSQGSRSGTGPPAPVAAAKLVPIRRDLPGMHSYIIRGRQ